MYRLHFLCLGILTSFLPKMPFSGLAQYSGLLWLPLEGLLLSGAFHFHTELLVLVYQVEIESY